jgi:hypothetical protein
LTYEWLDAEALEKKRQQNWFYEAEKQNSDSFLK